MTVSTPKRARLAPAQQAVEAPPPASPAARRRPKPVVPQLAASPPGRPATSAASSPHQAMALSPNSGFQAAVNEKLKNLCGEHEDAKVLAEYIVVMVAGNKGREDMTAELRPFFPDQGQTNQFVDWVEECKWKFLTGGPSPKLTFKGGSLQRAGAAQLPNGAGEAAAPGRPQNGQGSSSRALLESQRPAPPSLPSQRMSPHVAVTNRVVLQPNPSFDTQPSRQGAPVAASPRPQVTKASTPSKTITSGNPAKREKNELLENMTRQLQVILTKLNDRNLNDETREKYQALAQSIQTQMTKISRPQATKPVLRGGRR